MFAVRFFGLKFCFFICLRGDFELVSNFFMFVFYLANGYVASVSWSFLRSRSKMGRGAGRF